VRAWLRETEVPLRGLHGPPMAQGAGFRAGDAGGATPALSCGGGGRGFGPRVLELRRSRAGRPEIDTGAEPHPPISRNCIPGMWSDPIYSVHEGTSGDD
jgi:hypothetical protein